MTALTAPRPTLFDLLDAKIEDYERRGATDVYSIERGQTLRGDVLAWGTVAGDYTEYRNATMTADRNGRIILHPHNLDLPSRVLRGDILLLTR